MNTRFDDHLNRIAQNICQKELKYCGPGLLTGKTGIALFLFYQSRISGNQEYSKIAGNMIVEVFRAINSGFNFPTYCDGISGFAWAVEHLVQQRFIAREDVPFLDEFDQVIYKQMTQQIRNEDWDFLHGYIGSGIYFIERLHKPKSIEYLQELLIGLEKQSTKEGDQIYWTGISEIEEGAIGCNLGLAHGMGSIISFLSRLINIKETEERATYLMNGALNYMDNHKLNFDSDGMSYPNVIFNETILTKGRRIGWCYGDMGRGFAFYQAAKATKNSELKNHSVQVMLNTTKYRDLETEDIKDPGLCHGTAGIAHMYNRMFHETDIVDFKEASEYWLNQTLTMPKFINGMEDFDKWFPEQESKKQEFGILVGITGIGLALMSIDHPSYFGWDRSLLLS